MSTRVRRRSKSDPSGERSEESAEPARSRRARLLEQGPIDTGLGWAAGWREHLRREGRLAQGGWPGTLQEARVRIAAYLSAELGQKAMIGLTYEEREQAARATYASARRNWLAHRDIEEPVRDR